MGDFLVHSVNENLFIRMCNSWASVSTVERNGENNTQGDLRGIKGPVRCLQKGLVYSLFGAFAGMTKEYNVFPIPALAGMTKGSAGITKEMVFSLFLPSQE